MNDTGSLNTLIFDPTKQRDRMHSEFYFQDEYPSKYIFNEYAKGRIEFSNSHINELIRMYLEGIPNTIYGKYYAIPLLVYIERCIYDYKRIRLDVLIEYINSGVGYTLPKRYILQMLLAHNDTETAKKVVERGIQEGWGDVDRLEADILIHGHPTQNIDTYISQHKLSHEERSSYANELTERRIRENKLDKNNQSDIRRYWVDQYSMDYRYGNIFLLSGLNKIYLETIGKIYDQTHGNKPAK